MNAPQTTSLNYIKYFPEDLPDLREKRGTLGEEPRIHPSCYIIDSHIGAWTDLFANCMLLESSFDDYSYAAGDVSIVYTDVGKFCSIASHVRINPGNHPMERVMQHHMTYRRMSYGFDEEDDEEFFQWRRNAHCSIGHDVWIGHGAIIMPGVTVGTGAVIGAGAVVTKDIAPYEIAVGVPGRPIRKRFDDATIEKLLSIAWWDWDRLTIEARFDELRDVGSFVDKYS